MAATDIDLIEMRDSAVACGDGDIFELDVHIVFGCIAKIGRISVWLSRVIVNLRKKKLGCVPSSNFPRYTCPEVISSVTTWPCECY